MQQRNVASGRQNGLKDRVIDLSPGWSSEHGRTGMNRPLTGVNEQEALTEPRISHQEHHAKLITGAALVAAKSRVAGCRRNSARQRIRYASPKYRFQNNSCRAPMVAMRRSRCFALLGPTGKLKRGGSGGGILDCRGWFFPRMDGIACGDRAS